MKKKYTKTQIMESIKYWQKQLKMMNESYSGVFYVDAHTKDGFKMSDEINANSLDELAQNVREIIVYHRDGIHDTSEIDCSWVPFEYDKVEIEDENSNIIDITREANMHK